MQRILFVDPDHGARSQLAEALLRRAVADLALPKERLRMLRRIRDDLEAHVSVLVKVPRV